MTTTRKTSPEGARFAVLAKELEGVETKVGWFETNKYPDGTPVAYVASIQEFGYAEGGIPPRPFFRPTIVAQSNAWANGIGQAARRVIAGSMTPFQAMDALGLAAAGDVRKAIADLTSPTLSKRTLAARKKRGNNSTKPLVDTRVLMPTLTHQTEQSK